MTNVMKLRTVCILAVGLMLHTNAVALASSRDIDMTELSLEELMNMEITTASNRLEKLSEAPSTVIVITRQDIVDRGYNNLIDILSDLPGMDVVIAYGDDYFRNYWRGYRNNISAPYLLMLDGVIFNHLYLNSASIMAAFPLSNIDRVEFVYGPASSVYGANAFMGVVNVITKQDSPEPGADMSADITYGSNERKIADVNMSYQENGFRFSATGRFENGDVRDDDVYNRFEWTKDKYYKDESLWGGFVKNPNTGGRFSSPIKNRALDVRGYFSSPLGNTELAGQYFSLNSGYGYSYPADKGQNHAIWNREEKNVYGRHRVDLDDLSSTTLLRYRESNITNDSYFVENYQGFVDLSYWQSLNSSLSLFQDFELAPVRNLLADRLSPALADDLALLAGLKYEEKDLQREYDINYGPSVLPEDLPDAAEYSYPKPPQDVERSENRITTEDIGAYLQAKYSFDALNGRQNLHLGARFDHNSDYGDATTFRAGYVGVYGRIIGKALFGEAYQEPSARQRFGGWAGTGSDPDIDPERSTTYELSLTYVLENLSTTLSLYRVENSDTILLLGDGARNVGSRTVHGVDYHIQTMFRPAFMNYLKLWGYYSFIRGRGDEVSTTDPTTFERGDIGDLANHKFHLGATGVVNDMFTATLRGRYIGERDTVATNPICTVDDYFTADAFLRFSPLEKLAMSVRIDNIFDANYEHPGIRSANSGNTPGEWNGDTWLGSAGWFNSLIPQPGRTFWLSLNLGF